MQESWTPDNKKAKGLKKESKQSSGGEKRMFRSTENVVVGRYTRNGIIGHRKQTASHGNYSSMTKGTHQVLQKNTDNLKRELRAVGSNILQKFNKTYSNITRNINCRNSLLMTHSKNRELPKNNQQSEMYKELENLSVLSEDNLNKPQDFPDKSTIAVPVPESASSFKFNRTEGGKSKEECKYSQSRQRSNWNHIKCSEFSYWREHEHDIFMRHNYLSRFLNYDKALKESNQLFNTLAMIEEGDPSNILITNWKVSL